MANINISWTKPTDVSDTDSYELFVCDGTPAGHFNTGAALQTKLQAVHDAADADKATEMAAQGLVLIESITDLDREAASHTIAGTGSPVSYHFGIASKNQGGYKVQDDTSVFPLSIS